MLKIDSQNMGFSATSFIDEMAVASFNANYNGEKAVYINMNIVDYALFENHKDAIHEDYTAFCDEVIEIVKTLNEV